MQDTAPIGLSADAKKAAVFKMLDEVRIQLFEGKQDRLAGAIRVDPSTISRWIERQAIGMNPDARGNDYEVIIHLIAIYRSLTSLFANPKDRQRWFTSPNNHLHGETPENMVSSGIEGLLQVRHYLDFMRGLGA